MRVLLFLGLGLLASASAFVEVNFDYHNEIGIPAAAKIKENEERLLALTLHENRIVGGAVAPANAHPYFAGLLISLVGVAGNSVCGSSLISASRLVGVAGNSVCGSSLISASRLVTAAHCWRDRSNQAWQFLVILGSNQLFSGGTRIATSNVIMHPQYVNANYNNDVAMIILPMSVWFSSNIQPISLPSGWDLWDQFVGNWAVAAGFGKINDQQQAASTIVSHVNLQVISVAQCQAVFGIEAVISSTLCTNGAGGIGVCGGDSGGPLVLNRNGFPTLIGVTSFVAKDGCQLGHPSAFARVTSFMSFIQQYL
uniref:Peptidase S1 domain-containing protein n=1 Tax=Heliothis virescens TaxID=7102 RepID=A0A2A4JKX6_HELVI